jgi:tripartite-type tricarboxylate transporter receptor subunit TctC
MTNWNMFRNVLAALGLLVSASAAAQPAGTYPDKPVRLVVPFLAGGGADSVSRIVAAKASEFLGQQIAVENRPGAGGNVGAVAVAKSPPDGYVLFHGTNGTHGSNHALYKDPGYDPTKDFAPVARLDRVPLILVVNAASPIKSVAELIQDAKANPGKRTFGSGGNGTAPHMGGEIFKSVTGTDMVHVAYRGNAAAIVDLLGGRLDMMFDLMSNAYPQVKGGKLRALGVLSRVTEEAAPEIPTLDSQGLKGFDVSAWDAVFAPAGTPRPIIEKLNAAYRSALNDPKVKESMVSRGAMPVPGSPEDLGRFVEQELVKWGSAVRKANIRLD